jgi:amidase
MTEAVFIDRSIGEFAYAPETPPRARVAPGETLRVQTRDPRSGAILVGEPGTFQAYPPPPGGKSNALTGPILVEGAEPGDALVIDLLDLRLEKVGYMAAGDHGWVVPKGRIEDRKIGIVSVEGDQVLWRDGLRLPFRPMIGEIGVARADGPRSGSIGANGGNFDNILITTGCRLFLPVFVPGALLYLGDAHAAMGDGELSCGGVEIDAEVTLRVDVRKGVALPQPRLETPDRVVTTGWSRDFSEARRMAVDDMITLMQSGMGISAMEALMLIGVAGDLRIGQSCGNMEMTMRLEMPRFPGLAALPSQ